MSRWVSVHGLNHHEMRLLAEKVSDQPETLDTGDKLVEFSLPSWQVKTLWIFITGCCQLFTQLTNGKFSNSLSFPPGRSGSLVEYSEL